MLNLIFIIFSIIACAWLLYARNNKSIYKSKLYGTAIYSYNAIFYLFAYSNIDTIFPDYNHIIIIVMYMLFLALFILVHETISDKLIHEPHKLNDTDFIVKRRHDVNLTIMNFCGKLFAKSEYNSNYVSIVFITTPDEALELDEYEKLEITCDIFLSTDIKGNVFRIDVVD